MTYRVMIYIYIYSGASDPSTGYIAPKAKVDITANIVYSYEYVLLMGTPDTVRSGVYTLHAQRQQTSLADYFNSMP